MCPTGLGNPNASCRFHLPVDEYTEGMKCPTCNKELVKSTENFDKITKTIIGDEEVENEINPDHPRPVMHGLPVKTETQKEKYRARRKDDIKNAIKEARKLEDKE
jgi:hypothetical protein